MSPAPTPPRRQGRSRRDRTCQPPATKGWPGGCPSSPSFWASCSRVPACRRPASAPVPCGMTARSRRTRARGRVGGEFAVAVGGLVVVVPVSRRPPRRLGGTVLDAGPRGRRCAGRCPAHLRPARARARYGNGGARPGRRRGLRARPRLLNDTSSGLPCRGTARRYTVRWRVTSADGRPVSGTFMFHAPAAGGRPEETAAVGDGAHDGRGRRGRGSGCIPVWWDPRRGGDPRRPRGGRAPGPAGVGRQLRHPARTRKGRAVTSRYVRVAALAVPLGVLTRSSAWSWPGSSSRPQPGLPDPGAIVRLGLPSPAACRTCRRPSPSGCSCSRPARSRPRRAKVADDSSGTGPARAVRGGQLSLLAVHAGRRRWC